MNTQRGILHYSIPISLSIFAVLLAFSLFCSTGRDDSHITLWPAYTLSKYGSIVNYNGQNVEQSSSLLFVVLLAFIHKITGGHIVTLGWILSLISGILCGICAYLLFRRVVISPFLKLSTPLILLNPFFAYWSFSGMETTLDALGVIIFVHALYRGWAGAQRYYLVHLFFTSLLFFAIRPENIFISVFSVVLLAGLEWVTTRNSPGSYDLSKVGRILITLILSAILLLIVRLVLFNAFLPQPVYAKVGGNLLEMMGRGWIYFGVTIVSIPFIFILLPLLIAIVIHVRTGILNKGALPIIYIYILVSGIFIITVGGDWMEAGRFFVPIIPLAMIVIIHMFNFIKWRYLRLIMIIGLLTGQVIGTIHVSVWQSTGRPIWTYHAISNKIVGQSDPREYSFFEIANRIHQRDLTVIPELSHIIETIREAKDEPLSILSIQSGMVMFHTMLNHYGDVRFIDLYGLSTKDFTDCAISSALPRKAGGISLDYDLLFRSIDEYQTSCNLEPPDIIFDLDNVDFRRAQYLSENGYTVVYQQSGNIKTGSILEGGIVSGNEFIAIKNEYSALFLNTTKVVTLIQ